MEQQIENQEVTQSSVNLGKDEEHVHGPNCQHHHHETPLKPFIRTQAKTGRNDPCHCGSLVKFKKCCGK